MNDDPDSPGAAPSEIAVEVRAPSSLWRARLPDAAALLERAARAALAGAEVRETGKRWPLEISFLLANDASLQGLNRDFRGRDKVTNVLSFPAEGDDPGGNGDTGPRLLGDVAFAFETIEREAAAQSKPLAEHLSHLAVHGVLHLLGYDHVKAPEAERMERLEVAVLAELGIANPYVTAVRSKEMAP